MAAGYLGTALSKKLGIKEGSKISLINEPDHYWKLFSDFPVDIKMVKGKTKADFIHYFVKEEKLLKADISGLKESIEQNGMIWISWSKKSSKVQTDITEDVIRDLSLRNGLVDVKVCAVDETWSGLKLVIPVKNRK